MTWFKLFFSSQPSYCKASTHQEGICAAIISHNCETTSKKKREGNVLFPFLKRQILLMPTFNISARAWPVVLTTESNPSLNHVFTEPPKQQARERGGTRHNHLFRSGTNEEFHLSWNLIKTPKTSDEMRFERARGWYTSTWWRRESCWKLIS